MKTEPTRKVLANALRAAAEALESEPTPQPEPARPRYYTRRTAPIERRAWDRMIANATARLTSAPSLH